MPWREACFRFLSAIQIITLDGYTSFLSVIIDVIYFKNMIRINMIERLTSGCEGFMADTYRAFNIVASPKSLAVQGENKRQPIVSAEICLLGIIIV